MDDGLRWEGPTTAAVDRASESLKRGHSFAEGRRLDLVTLNLVDYVRVFHPLKGEDPGCCLWVSWPRLWTTTVGRH